MIRLGIISRGLAAGAVAAGCLTATGAYAATTTTAATQIAVVNNLDQPLKLVSKSVKLTRIGFVLNPPETIAAKSTVSFSIERSDKTRKLDEELKVNYTAEDGTVLSIRYLQKNNEQVCPKYDGVVGPLAPPITVTITDCGKFKSTNWTYTFTKR